MVSWICPCSKPHPSSCQSIIQGSSHFPDPTARDGGGGGGGGGCRGDGDEGVKLGTGAGQRGFLYFKCLCLGLLLGPAATATDPIASPDEHVYTPLQGRVEHCLGSRPGLCPKA